MYHVERLLFVPLVVYVASNSQVPLSIIGRFIFVAKRGEEGGKAILIPSHDTFDIMMTDREGDVQILVTS